MGVLLGRRPRSRAKFHQADQTARGRLSRQQRRVLKMLADAPRGVSGKVLVVAHGFSADMLAGLVWGGLATMATETRTVRRGVTYESELIRITPAGRQALEGHAPFR